MKSTQQEALKINIDKLIEAHNRSQNDAAHYAMFFPHGELEWYKKVGFVFEF
jgi:hypothetical protein